MMGSSAYRLGNFSLVAFVALACGGRTGLALDNSTQSTLGGNAVFNTSGGAKGSGGAHFTGGAKSTSTAGAAGYGLSSGGASKAAGGKPSVGGAAQGGSGLGGALTGGTSSSARVAAISAGNKYTCALLSNGTVKCWGSNERGRLGTSQVPLSAYTSKPTLTDISSATAISAGDQHACALLLDRTIRCWGNDTYGQLGDAGWADSSTSRFVVNISSAISVSAGYRHTCAILAENNTAYCWGDNSEGQLAADSGLYSANFPLQVGGLFGGVSAIGAGRSHTCALPVSALMPVTCWGTNTTAQLGVDASTVISYVPVGVTDLYYAQTLAVGDQHNCVSIAGTYAGTVKCWGWNYYGQLGVGNNTDSPTAAYVFALTSATAVAAADHSCALLSDGTVRCWGFNNSGELGDGTTTARNTPALVKNLSNVTQITTGPLHTCALLNDSRVMCWGDNTYGELGTSAVSQSTVPVAVVGL